MGAISYALWDMVTANFVAEFASEAEALQFVRDVMDDGERDIVEGWALGCEEPGGIGEQIAVGRQLVDRALAHTAA